MNTKIKIIPPTQPPKIYHIDWESRLYNLASRMFASNPDRQVPWRKDDKQTQEEFEEECARYKYDYYIIRAYEFVKRYKKLFEEGEINV